jgi:hypothetical protein
MWDTFVFTWPASLFAAFQGTVQTVVRAGRQPAALRQRWPARASVVCFLGLCLAYYLICRELGIVTGWGFLFGFLPAFPASVLSAKSRPIGSIVSLALGFGLYFWGAGLFTVWRMRS